MRFTKTDKDQISDYIVTKHQERKEKRHDLERQWTEIDRQLEMQPRKQDMKERQNELAEKTAWLAETELPNQSETLEITTSDARRLMMPKGADWYSAHVALTDDYLEKVDYGAMIAGDKNDVPSLITQDNADKLVQGLGNHWRKQYGFKANIDLINGEAAKYSVGVGRVRYAKKRVFLHTSKGVTVNQRNMPILVPRSIKKTYLDDSCHNLSNEGHIVAPGQIFEYDTRVKDLMLSSQKGSEDVNRVDGGWIKNAFRGWNEGSTVKVLEWEGDIVVPRKSTGSLYLPNAIISVAVGFKSGKNDSSVTRTIFRIRKNDVPYSSYILFPFNHEHIDNPYASSPLMKGRPIQMAGTSALNRLMELGALQTQPPVSRDPDDDEEPQVMPGAVWGAGVKPHNIGDPSAMLAVYQGLLQQYADVTGTTAPRLGQQTLSHTTAFAKDAELARGQVRVSDYVDSCLEGPLERFLTIEYEMGRKNMGEEMFFIKPYGGFVKVKKAFMPEYVEFEAFGAGQPADENAKFQKRMAALQQAIQIDQLNISMGNPPKLNIQGIIEQMLREGGWTDIDPIINQTSSAGMEPNPGLQVAAQQGLAFGT